MSVRTHKLRKWSSLGHRFGHRSELPSTFEFLTCGHFVHIVHDIFALGTQLSEAASRADINLLDECLQIQKSGKLVYQKSSFFVYCKPLFPESFMIVSNIIVPVQLFPMVEGFGGRSYQVTLQRVVFSDCSLVPNMSRLPKHRSQ